MAAFVKKININPFWTFLVPFAQIWSNENFPKKSCFASFRRLLTTLSIMQKKFEKSREPFLRETSNRYTDVQKSVSL